MCANDPMGGSPAHIFPKGHSHVPSKSCIPGIRNSSAPFQQLPARLSRKTVALLDGVCDAINERLQDIRHALLTGRHPMEAFLQLLGSQTTERFTDQLEGQRPRK